MLGPRTDCRSSTETLKSKLLVANRDPDTADLVVWKWIKGAATSIDDFGDPTGATSYTLCLFDQAGLLRSLTAPAGDDMRRSAVLEGDGHVGLQVSGRRPRLGWRAQGPVARRYGGKAKILLKARAPTSRPPELPLANLPVTAQLQRAGGGACWETTHAGAGILKNDGAQFKAKDD